MARITTITIEEPGLDGESVKGTQDYWGEYVSRDLNTFYNAHEFTLKVKTHHEADPED